MHSNGVRCHPREIHKICFVVCMIILLKIPMSKAALIICNFTLFKAFGFYRKQLHISRGLYLPYRSDEFNKYKCVTAQATLNHFKSTSLQRHKNMKEGRCGTVQDWTTKINVIHFRKEKGELEEKVQLISNG